MQFSRLEDARNALSLNGQLEIAGRMIKVMRIFILCSCSCIFMCKFFAIVLGMFFFVALNNNQMLIRYFMLH